MATTGRTLQCYAHKIISKYMEPTPPARKNTTHSGPRQRGDVYALEGCDFGDLDRITTITDINANNGSHSQLGGPRALRDDNIGEWGSSLSPFPNNRIWTDFKVGEHLEVLSSHFVPVLMTLGNGLTLKKSSQNTDTGSPLRVTTSSTLPHRDL